MLETVGVFEVPKQNGKYETGQVGMCRVSSRFHGLFCFKMEPYLATVLNFSAIFLFSFHISFPIVLETDAVSLS